MDFAANSSQDSGGFSFLIMLVLLFGAMYFLMIRPQQRRRREVEAMQSKMGPGDEVVTVGGLHGVIESIEDDTVLLEIAPDVVVRYARPAISKVLNPAADAETEDASADRIDEERSSTEGSVAEGTATGDALAGDDSADAAEKKRDKPE